MQTINIVLITLDSHLAGAARRLNDQFIQDQTTVRLHYHAAADWRNKPERLERCKQDIAEGDIIIVTMMFIEEHIKAVLPDLKARRDNCSAMVACMCDGEVIRLTRMGQFSMGNNESAAINWLKKLRGSKKKSTSSGAHQMAMLRRIPKILKYIPGTAQDVRSYFLVMQYWLACSDKNLRNMIYLLVDKYFRGEQKESWSAGSIELPEIYPDIGLYHPRMENSIVEEIRQLPGAKSPTKGTVGLLLMRSYVLSGDTAHFDGVIDALEQRGFKVVPAFASGLDSRPAIDKYFLKNDQVCVDAVVSLTGFSLVGGPAYNEAQAAQETLQKLDVPYIAAHALEFQSLDQWRTEDRGLLPLEATMMVAIPELDGATGPTVFGGRQGVETSDGPSNMIADPERIGMLADRVEKLIALRETPVEDRKIAIVLFNFPPNSGNTGTAAHLSVFKSLLNCLNALQQAGYSLSPPGNEETLKSDIIDGNAEQFGTDCNVHHSISADDHIRHETWLGDIEAQWGTAPGRHQSDGNSIFVFGKQYGNVFVGVQPAFGYEGDPMRLLFEKNFAPTHAFSAFYRYLRSDFGAHAVVHFGTHGALEFMPGKQTGLTNECWPDRLISDLPNFYVYAANNPSEGIIAKRRAAATTITYLTPPVTQAGLYKGLLDLKSTIDRWRTVAPDSGEELNRLASVIQSQALELELVSDGPAWNAESTGEIENLSEQVLELEYSLIPHGLHVMGETASREERIDLLAAIAEASDVDNITREFIAELVDERALEQKSVHKDDQLSGEAVELSDNLRLINELLQQDHEIPALLHALDGGFIRPVPGGDVIRSTEILPTGRNLHGFDPFRIPSRFAVSEGILQADLLIEKHQSDGHGFPESIAIVLWGTDNLKNEGGPISQALALMGAKPRFDGYGRLCGAEVIPLEMLNRPRVDVIMTISGIFRDLLPLQTRLLAEAASLVAAADEPEEMNFLRKHALAYMAANDCDLNTASLRVFSNAEGAYGSNVNHLIDSGCWSDDSELADTYQNRKCFAYDGDGKPVKQTELLRSILGNVELSYQNLESVELGITTIDHYFDTLGGIGRVVKQVQGEDVPVYIGDQTRGTAKVRTLNEQVALETRTRTLNPKWYEGMLDHGYEGVRQIEAQITNTMGWSATTGQVDSWIYQQITDTYVLDDEMRERLANLNSKASAKLANRLLEAHDRRFWSADEETLEALHQATEALEDRLEGVTDSAAA